MDSSDQIVSRARDLHRNGDIAGAEALYQKALTLDPSHALAEAGLGIVALQRGALPEARDRLTKASARAPNEASIHNNLGNVLLSMGDVKGAEEAFSAAISTAPSMLDAHYNRAVARQHLRRPAEAEEDYRHVLAAAPDHQDAAVNLAALYRLAEDPKAGVTTLVASIAAAGTTGHPISPEALLALASLYETIGKADEADQALFKLPDDRQQDPQAILTRARLCLRRNQPEDGLSTLAHLPSNAPAQVTRQALSLRGLLLDRQGHTDDAYTAFTAANAAMRASHPDADRMATRYRQRIKDFRDHLSTPSALPLPSNPLPFQLVFFCGFPRSGTTLMEQILEAHPATATTGEDSPLHHLYETLPPPSGGQASLAEQLSWLSEEERNTLRERFVKVVHQTRGDLTGRCLIDKLPLNLVELGAIATLFPEAKLLVAIRDPRDCVLSAFMQSFRLNDAMACLTRLEDAARTYSDVFALYAYQKQQLDLPILEYRYEDLIDDFVGTVQSVVEFIGLPWDDRIESYRDGLVGRYIATPSYMAVTQGLNRSAIGRWRRYERQMADVLRILAPWIATHGYQTD